MEIAAKIEELTKAKEGIKAEAESSGDWDNYFKKMQELSNISIIYAFDCVNSLDFSSAYNYFAFTNEIEKELYNYNEQNLNNLDKEKDENKSIYETIKKSLEEIGDLINLTQGYANFSLGQLNRINRNPGNAIENFKEAKEIFDLIYEKKNESIFKFLSDYSHAMGIFSEGLEDFYRLNFNNAKKPFQRAKISFQNISEELSNIKEIEEQYAKIVDLLTNDITSCEQLYLFSDYKDQFDKGNFSLAREQAEKLCNIFHKTIEATSKDSFSKPQLNVRLGDYHFYFGYKYLAEGELFREQEKWDDSLKSYKNAKDEWENSADFYLKSGIPQAIAMQETVINSSSIVDVYIRQCKKERELKSELKKLENELNNLQRSLTEAIKPSGVVINSNQEMVSTVEQNVQIIQTIENNIRQNIEKIVEQLPNLPLDTGKREEIKNKANDILNSKEHGNQFIEKAKKFTQDISEITKNLGEIAKPILPFISALALLL